MNKLVEWIVRSSENPNKASMTIKGILIANIAFIMLIMKLAHVSISETEVYAIIGDVSLLLGSILTVFGLSRKIAITLRNTFKKI